MGRVMHRDREDVMMDSNQAGVDRVIADNGEYAFFMESTSIEYQVSGTDFVKDISSSKLISNNKYKFGFYTF